MPGFEEEGGAEKVSLLNLKKFLPCVLYLYFRGCSCALTKLLFGLGHDLPCLQTQAISIYLTSAMSV